MAQYDDPRNPFSAGRPEAGSPWGESPPGPSPSRDGLQLPGETDPGGWGRDGQQRPSPVARRRNQWRQHQQLAPDFGPAPVEPESEPVIRPAARNASLPTFRRGPAQPPTNPKPAAPRGPIFEPHPAPLAQAVPPIADRPGAPPLQMHPHSIHPSTLNPNGAVAPSRGPTAARALPPNVTPLRPQSRRSAIAAAPPSSAVRPIGPRCPGRDL